VGWNSCPVKKDRELGLFRLERIRLLGDLIVGTCIGIT